MLAICSTRVLYKQRHFLYAMKGFHTQLLTISSATSALTLNIYIQNSKCKYVSPQLDTLIMHLGNMMLPTG